MTSFNFITLIFFSASIVCLSCGNNEDAKSPRVDEVLSKENANTKLKISEAVKEKNKGTRVVCNTILLANDEDKSGLNVRKGPGTNYDIIGKIPWVDPDGDIGEISIKVVGYQDGWFEISAYHYHDKIDIRGWVSANKTLTLSKEYETGKAPLYQDHKKADNSSKIDGNIPVQPLECFDTWIKVSCKGKTGWLHQDNQCPSTRTTCS